MRIVNPLYDTAFKYLMENDRLAKKILSIILEEEVLELSVGMQETHVPNQKHGLTLFRLDFKATVLGEDGKKRTVLLELQKSKFSTDILRFRTYLGQQYRHKERVTDEFGIERDTAYPIVTIYILGYPLAEIPHMAVTVERKVVDSVSKEELSIESPFIEQLTHRSHILQARRLPEERRTRLEHFMSFFDPRWQSSESSYLLDIPDEEIPEEFRDMATYLQGPTMDESFRKQLDAEQELDQIFDVQESKHLHQLKVAQQEAEEAKHREEEAKRREEEAILKTKDERIQKEALQVRLIQVLHAQGLSVEEIAKELQVSTGFVSTALAK